LTSPIVYIGECRTKTASDARANLWCSCFKKSGRIHLIRRVQEEYEIRGVLLRRI